MTASGSGPWSASEQYGREAEPPSPRSREFFVRVSPLGNNYERRDSGIPQQEGLKMSDWRIRYEDADGRDAQSTRLCKEDAIVQALFRERRQQCRIQIIEGPDGELIDRETFEREHLKRPSGHTRPV
jgi:hypothetical protein